MRIDTLPIPERGKNGKVLFTPAHDAAIRHVYRQDRTLGELEALSRQLGVSGCVIMHRAKHLGCEVQQFKFRVTEAQKARIVEVYSKRQKSGNKILAHEFGWPTRTVSREAVKLGMEPMTPITRNPFRSWGEIEGRMVLRHVHLPIGKIRQILAQAGYRRTHEQITSYIGRMREAGKCPHFGVAIENEDYLTVEGISAGLAVGTTTVLSWIKRGMLSAKVGARERWLISHHAFREFLIKYRAHWRPYWRNADMDFVIDALCHPGKSRITDEDRPKDRSAAHGG